MSSSVGVLVDGKCICEIPDLPVLYVMQSLNLSHVHDAGKVAYYTQTLAHFRDLVTAHFHNYYSNSTDDETEIKYEIKVTNNK